MKKQNTSPTNFSLLIKKPAGQHNDRDGGVNSL